jgi:protein-S-isoprenylcysteine O-methyltransferase Ste14
MTTPTIAVAAYALFAALAFGFRSWLQWRRTGRTGFVGFAERPGSAAWWGGVLFALSIVVGAASPVLQLAGVVAPWAVLDGPPAHAAGLVLYAIGMVATLWAQLAMGDSWRIGVDATARTSLVVGGPFRWVRNPIYTGMLSAMVGLSLLVPNVASAIAVAALVVGLELHVRLVEEPYLRRVHGDGYLAYAARTGRFAPGVGRLSRAG